MLFISDAVRVALFNLRARGVRQYVLAQRAGLHPSLLSNLINGAVPIHPNDPRVLKIAAAVGVPAEQAFCNRDEAA